jgi:aspartate kinase
VKGVTADAELCVLHAAFGRERLGELLEFLDARGLPSRALSFDGLSERAGVYLLMPLQDVHGLDALAGELQTRFAGAVRLERELGSVTCVGVGVGTSLGPLRTVLEIAEAAGVRVHAVDTSALQVSVLVPRGALPELTRRLHQALVQG